MSVRKLTFGLLAAAALLAGQQVVVAQEHLPVADPFHFDPDFRWFEPVYEADLLDMKPSKRASTGWYGSYDRMVLLFSRPDTDILLEPNGSDYSDGFDRGWGNRLELGYMLEKNSGWSATWHNISGPNSYETLLVERLNRLNEEDLAGPDTGDDGGDGGGDGGGNFNQFGQLLPSADRNLHYFNERLYELADSVNVLSAHSFEINKTWRMEPYHYGGILEPLVGLRYFGVTDRWQRERYSRGVDIDDNPIETLSHSGASAKNNMFGGQLGARYFKYYNRVTYSAEFRAMGLHNFQNHRTVSEQIVTTYDGIGIGSEVISEVLTRNTLIHQDNSEFVVGYDIRGEVSYQLARHFQLRGGLQLIDLARGVWRGERFDSNDQRLFMVGATFGFAINR